jgi:asparagine synthase (glutamine-hydrolysing)
MDLGLHAGVSIWKVAATTLRDIRYLIRRRRWNPYEEDLRNDKTRMAKILVADGEIEGYIQELIYFTHPWLQSVRGVPFGKLPLIGCLMGGGCYDEQFQRASDAPSVSPFLSQPLAELCLRIPSFLSAEGGVDRLIARKAFSEELPSVVLNRIGKGHQVPWLRTMIERDGEFLRDFLLEGFLASSGVLDREKLRRTLPGEVSSGASHPGGLMDLLYAEAWARSWQRAPPPLRLLH